MSRTSKQDRGAESRRRSPEDGQLRPAIAPNVAPGGAPIPRGIRVRQHRLSARLYLPALGAFASAFFFSGADGDAVLRAGIFALTVVAVARLLRDFPYPLRLIPASRVALALLPLLAGASALGAVAAAGVDGFWVGDVAPELAVGVVIALLVELFGDLAVASRPMRIAVLGSADFVPAIRRELDAIGGRRELEVIGWLNIGGRNSLDGQAARAQTLGSVRATIIEHEIDLLVRGPGSGVSRPGRDAYDTIAAGCLDLPVRMIDGNQLYEQIFGHVPIGTIDSAWFLFLMHPSFRASSKASKRAVDLLVGSLAGLIVLPLVMLGAIAIKLGDRGPILYRQRRVGERGREFEILKLRTMRTDAQASGARWAAASDERITWVGRGLRRLHIDELPQLVNVLRGDMTLVGPRPEQPEITAKLENVFPHYSRRLLVKPGVTGWAQVRCGYAGTHVGTAWKLCHDLYYLKHRSTLIDLLIMLETVVIAARDSHRPMRAPEVGFLYRTVEGAARIPTTTGEHGAPPSLDIPLESPLSSATPAGAPATG